MDTVTGLMFRAGRETAAFDEAALRTAEQAKRRAAKRGQGRLQHQASMLVTAIKASYKTTAALEMAKEEISALIDDVCKDGDGCPIRERLWSLYDCLRTGEIPESPKPLRFWVRVRRVFSGRKSVVKT